MQYLKKMTVCFMAVMLFGCATENSDSGINTPVPGNMLPNSYGRPNQILVVADSNIWQSTVGDSFFYYFAAPYLLLPQPEPIFDIQHITPEDLAKKPARKEFKSIVFLSDMTDDNSLTSQQVLHDVGAAKVEEAKIGKGYTTIVGQNKWALNQQLFYMVGLGADKLAACIGQNFAPVARRINERDHKMIEANTYQSGINATIEAELLASFGVRLKVPGSYKKIIYDSNTNTVWLRSDDRDVVANMLVHRRKYVNEAQLSYEGLKSIRNEVGKIITSQQPDSYMQINDIDLPLFVEKKTLNGAFALQAKGIWEMVNDYKGGAFVSYLLLDQPKGELVFVDGFLYAPSLPEKRDHVQELEFILSSIETAVGDN